MIAYLDKTLQQAGYKLSSLQHQQLEQYCSQLIRWNHSINLTSIDKADVLTHHLLDSLSITDDLRGKHILDMGTGGGLPGVPLAITLPEVEFTLLDARNKKVQFLQYIKGVLNIANIHPLHQRVESHQPQPLYDCVVARAFTSMERIYQLAKPLIKQNGRICAMKGKNPEEELNALQRIGVNYKVKSLDVFGLDAERHLVIIDND